MVRAVAEFDTAHCGAIHDVQLDGYGQSLATASADGHVRLWDVQEPEKPRFLADLGGHAGAVRQVSWASPDQGVLLASAGDDGRLLVWGRSKTPGKWLIVHAEDLCRHGGLRAVAWAHPERGAVLACASSDGTVTIVSHAGAVETEEGEIEHRWTARPFQAHQGPACAVSWATPRSEPGQPVGLAGARLATAGEDGVRVWSWDAGGGGWEPEVMEAPEGPVAPARDVAWKEWDGVRETLASATGQDVVVWEQPPAGAGAAGQSWRSTGRAELGEEVWKLSFTDLGGLILASVGEKEQKSILLKCRLDGVWDAMPMEEDEDEGEEAEAEEEVEELTN